jgi:hypothetical protein
MGKGSMVCDRPVIPLGASDDAEPKATLNMGVAEINTTLELQRAEHRWWTKDYLTTFQKRKWGWVVFTYSTPVRKAFREYGIIDPTRFPSLKEARQAVNDVSLEVGLNIDPRLTRENFIAYKIGDLPLIIRRGEAHWLVRRDSSCLSQSLKKHFNSVKEFRAAWESTDSAFVHYPTRHAAHQAVTNWFAQTITKEE